MCQQNDLLRKYIQNCLQLPDLIIRQIIKSQNTVHQHHRPITNWLECQKCILVFYELFEL